MRRLVPALLVVAACSGGSSGSGGTIPRDEAGAPIADASAPPPGTALATFDGFVLGMVVDGDAIYFGLGGISGKGSRIGRLPIAGGELAELATDAQMSASIAVDATDVYWGNRGGKEVRRVPKAGGAHVVVTKLETDRPAYVAVDDANVYVQSEAGDVVRVFAKAGTAGPVIGGSGGVNPCGMVLDGSTLYTCGSGGIYSVPKTGGTRTDVVGSLGTGPKGSILGFALDGASGYVSVNVDPCVRKGMLFLPALGGDAQDLAVSCGTSHLVATGGTVYWTASYTGLSSIPGTGGTRKDYDKEALGPLALDATNIYYTRRDEARGSSTLYRIAK